MIDSFAIRFNTPVFSPHITFGSLPDLPVGQLSSALDSVFEGSKPIELDADFVRCSTSPFQNLVHQYKLNKPFKEISDRAEKSLSGFRAKDEIHISLMYGYIDCDILEKLINDLVDILPKKVRLSEYQIIGLTGQVRQWKTLYKKSV